ncbi:phosphatidylinositol 3,4,5-trisphosphate 3-phosphatase and protein-tyrosine-phosphatase PTEN2A-like [Cynara cardunculus var. scolymus]|uniref:phosphatidylinositol 3,4,5-trisphosphate 3-phosphatase and protein-tyrosine-phosphatase PTEN2A-like n=1 Tax=Cynara cardunculus var. scolymus TaxID=59895 RepID=UPI000D62BA79|nr:phosphatidylinositol 3,4,5-trisphosphate 3-phosphatase and protein-tyrosine-phosphatase PTEN2A-like [Cynara cardunculus var. scolymus]
MASESAVSSQSPTEVTQVSDVKTSASTVSAQTNSSAVDSSLVKSTPIVSSSDEVPNFPKPMVPAQNSLQAENTGKWAIARLASGFGLHLKAAGANDNAGGITPTSPSAVLQSVGKGLVDTSLGAVKAVQVKARHMVSQNKRRYQEGGFDLDLTYITDNIIAMGFPAGDMSSGLFGYFEGFYRNHMEEVIKFFETHHKDRYKVYNLCSERLYDASLFAGKVASFPFNDHNCPPIHLVPLFCQSAYSWLKADILNVVVVHCKAGKARTGLMICSLLLFLKFFPTAQECIDYYNQRRCVDGKGLILPSQIRYVKYFERILTEFNGESPPGRRCMLRGFRLHECPYWVRPSITISDHNGILFTTKKHPKTKNLMPEDFWIRAPTKGIVVFALPGEPGLTELMGDFKIQFHDRQGDFYCWLNTTMMENRLVLSGSDFDDFDKRKLPVPGFKVEVVMIDYDGTIPEKYKTSDKPSTSSNDSSAPYKDPNFNQNKASGDQENDNVFSDSDDGDEPASTDRNRPNLASRPGTAPPSPPPAESGKMEAEVTNLRKNTEQLSLNSRQQSIQGSNNTRNEQVERSIPNLNSGDIKAIAADASVFSFGDDEDDESE